MNRYRRITVKIGSNVLTRPDGTLDVTRVSDLVDQIAALRHAGVEVVMISSGAVACGRSELRGLPGADRLDNVERRQLFSAVGQVKLINRYYDLFREQGFNVGQVLTMKESFATRQHYLNQRSCMMVMLENGVIPIINENDTVSVTELMFTDNDELSGLVAAMLDCDALIILSNIDGIFDGNPKDPASKVIRTVDPSRDLSDYIMTERSGFGRGGMVTKHRIARKVAAEGIEVIIANGTRPEILTSLVLGTPEHDPVSTRFEPSSAPASSLKRWIAHSEGFAKGCIMLDDNAVEAITSVGAASVLPVGVTAVEGDFEKDDLVRVVDSDRRLVAIGRVSFDSAMARGMMGRRDCKPLIHYDYLYIE